jgi:hypothetical protein
MDTVEYNSLDSEQFETYQSIPEKKKSLTKTLLIIALIGIAAYAGYQLGKRMKNSRASSNKKEEKIRSKNFKVFESGSNG